MEYRKLGTSDLEVSRFGLGVMTFGGQTPEEEGFRQLDIATEAGINLFDTAENYPTPNRAGTQGRSEEVLGKWIASRKRRDSVVVATKVTGPENPVGDMSYIRGKDRRLDRRNILAAVEASLSRLGTDYIDLYQVHWPERAVSTAGRQRFSLLPRDPDEVPIEEKLSVLGDLVKEGKVRSIGVCNETPWGMMRYLAAAETLGLPRVVSIQNSYSLLDRQFDIGLAEVAIRENIGLLAYSPLASGTLTGKYGTSAQAIPGSRSSESAAFTKRLLTLARIGAIEAYAQIARDHGIEPAHLALAFAAQQPFMGSVLMAASTGEQLLSNIGAIDLELPSEAVKAVNAVHDSHPNPK